MNIFAFLVALAALIALGWDIYKRVGPGLGQWGKLALWLFILAFILVYAIDTPHQFVVHIS